MLAFFQGLPPDQWEQEVYHEGERWRARDMLAHFIAAEQGFQELIESLAGGGPGAEPGFDVDAYNRRTVHDLRGQENEVLLGMFASVRERTTAIVRGLPAEQMEIRGRHPALGDATVEQMVRLIYHHNSLHLRDLKRALRGTNPGLQAQSGVTG